MPIGAYIRLARPAEWVKNLFVFPALLASGEVRESGSVWASLIAFAAFSFVASGIYCINDSLDYRNDRRHPVKRRRPIAAGLISPGAGRAAGIVWIGAGLGLSFLTGDAGLAGVLALYLLLQVLYNGVLKRLSIVDVIALSLGFVLRAWAGAVAIDVPASLWLLASVFCLCLFLALIKRLCDLSSMRGEAAVASGDEAWHSDAGYESGEELSWMLAVSAASAVACYLMYSMSAHAADIAGAGVRGLVLLTPFVLIAMFRIYRHALRGTHDSPFAIVVSDPIVVICSALFGIGSIVFLTWSESAQWIERSFGS